MPLLERRLIDWGCSAGCRLAFFFWRLDPAIGRTLVSEVEGTGGPKRHAWGGRRVVDGAWGVFFSGSTILGRLLPVGLLWMEPVPNGRTRINESCSPSEVNLDWLHFSPEMQKKIAIWFDQNDKSLLTFHQTKQMFVVRKMMRFIKTTFRLFIMSKPFSP